MDGSAAETDIQGFTILLVEDFTHLAFSCAIEPLRIANLINGSPLYSWRLVSETGTEATCSNGTRTIVDCGLEPVPAGDILLILSGINVERQITPKLLAYIRRERARGTRIGALCSGAYVLAKAGLLDGRRATIHWQFHDSFEELFPEVRLIRSVYVPDAKYPTASGGTATADLMLHLIGRAHGEELAIAVADQMLYNAARNADAAQRYSLQSRYGLRNTHIADAVRLMTDRMEDPMSPSEIAAELGISARQLERLFGRYMKCSPKKFATDLRLDRARNLLLQTELSVTEIAHACGFGSTGHFSRVYRSRFEVTPTRQRASHRLDRH
ncbi:AraC family transcriptional regulator with amidase-like domain [Aliiruegeria haliotis]|uniref:AraC family transcriptional regulator with amidase-like domain n=1 Tax=Aliiruegeria haliotis TaxID=1280846 RepID=A0A2T0RMZ6_9RHOB|nr:GlxA family transcriptional regulator [Aliiruegeria haliotis]PRY22565.1 AraC family transcriptional regulator with amidase-like domain [Aliiruegeria haliotis]